MTTIAAADLDMARLALEAAVDQLTKPGSERIATGDPERPHRWAGVPSLLVQLSEAREANGGKGGTASARSKAPCWIDAVALLHEIEREVRAYRRRDNLAARVRAWSSAKHALEDPAALDAVVVTAEEWVRRTRALLHPIEVVDLPGACPMCGADRVDEADDDDETVRRHALRAAEADASGVPVAWCTACTKRFEGEALWVLADHLDRQLAHETLATELVAEAGDEPVDDAA